MERVARDRFLCVELPQPVSGRGRIADRYLVVAGYDRAKLPPHERLGETPSDNIVDGPLLILSPPPLALKAKPRAGWARRRLDSLVVAAQCDRATADVAVVDRLEAITLAAFGSDLEPWDVDVRQCPQELEALFAVRETQLAREVRTTDTDRSGSEIERKQISSSLRRADEVIGAEEPMILFAVEQSREPALDRDEPVGIGADRDAVCRMAKLAACMEG